MQRCIFRYIYNDGARCTAEQMAEDCKYCKKHKSKNNYIFDLMDAALSKNNVDNEQALYEIFRYIYDNDLQMDDNHKKKLFFAIVAYLLSKKTLITILYKTICLNGKNNMQADSFQKKTKRNVITFVHEILMNTYNLSKSAHDQICKIQRFARRHIYRKLTQYNSMPCENTEDPFTYDSIEEIPADHKFGYKDSNGHIYIFNTVEFEYYLRSNTSPCNPYTKEELPQYVVNRLYLLMQYNKLKQKQDDEFKWQTTLQAYTDLSQAMERAGFYTSVEWFEKITFNTCKAIISSYKRMSNNNSYFGSSFEMSNHSYVFDFCKVAIGLFKDADDHYLLCCNFVKALAAHVHEFKSNMPTWLLDDVPAPNTASAYLFMYVQDLLETMDEDDGFDVIERRRINLINGNISRILFE